MNRVHPTLQRFITIIPTFDEDALDGTGAWTVDAEVEGVRFTITRGALADAVDEFAAHCEDVGGASIALVLPSDVYREVLATDRTLRSVAQSWMAT